MSEGGHAHIRTDATHRAAGNSIVSRSIDSIFSSPWFEGKLVEFMKIDVEGHELKVLKGAFKTLMSHRVRHLQVEIGQGFDPKNSNRWERAGSDSQDAVGLLTMLNSIFEIRFILSHGAQLVPPHWKVFHCKGFRPSDAISDEVETTDDYGYALVTATDILKLFEILMMGDVNLWLRLRDGMQDADIACK